MVHNAQLVCFATRNTMLRTPAHTLPPLLFQPYDSSSPCILHTATGAGCWAARADHVAVQAPVQGGPGGHGEEQLRIR